MPSIAKKISEVSKGVNTAKDKGSKQDKDIKKLKKELDLLTTVWSNEEEKTKNMQKLLTALFENVADMETHHKTMEDLAQQHNQEFIDSQREI